MTAPLLTATELRDVLIRDDTERPGQDTPVPFADGEIVWAVASAQAEVVGKVSSRYTLPADPANVPELLKDLTADIAVYQLWLRYRPGEITERDPVWLRWQRAEDLLTQIMDGQLLLPVDDPNGAQSHRHTHKRNPYDGRLFGLSDFGLGYDTRGCRRGC